MPQLVAAIGVIVAKVSAFAASSWLAGFAVRIVLSLGLSALARAMQKKRKAEQRGIKAEVTQTGGTDPLSFILGLYATGGQAVAPPMSHGSIGKTPNAYLTYVIAVCDLPKASLRKVIIDGAVCPIGGALHPDYGTPVTYRGRGDLAWIKWYDGTQTTADPMLLSRYGTYPLRPWTSDMIGRGVCYAILTFKGDPEVFKGFPQVRFEVNGIPLYDPRLDSSAGGSGPQRFADKTTWALSHNPAVMIYNILRGIALPSGDVWGGGWSQAELPNGPWFAAMNMADEPVPLAAGGTAPRYRAGFEVAVDVEPGDVIEELLKTCGGRTADVGGTMTIALGAAGFPIKAITDDDIIVTDEQMQSLFPSIAQTHNAVHATFPDPAALWESRDAPPRYDLVAEAQDGQRLAATVTLPACPYPLQVQRLMVAWLAEERRFRRHQAVLPPDAAILEPLDVISWTSARNGYASKFFEVVEVAHDPVSLLQAVGLREVDPADFSWSTTYELPWVPPTSGIVEPPPQDVGNWDVQGTALDDATATARRPALLLTWDGTDLGDVSALEYEVRRLGGTQVVGGVTTNVAAGSQIVAAGILPDTVYEARARFVARRPTLWSAWKSGTTPSAYITLNDFSDMAGLFHSAGLSVPSIVSVLPAAGPARFAGELVYLTSEAKLYRWDGSGWTASVQAADLRGLVGPRQLAVGDFSNLCVDPAFELQSGWTSTTGLVYSASNARGGTICMGRTWAAGMAAAGSAANDLQADCCPGDTFFVSAYVKKGPGAAATDAGVGAVWRNAAGAVIGTSVVTVADASVTAIYSAVSGHVTAPAGAAKFSMQLVVQGHGAGSYYWDDAYCNRANMGQLVVDGEILGSKIAGGTINGDRVEAGTLTAGLFAAGSVRARTMLIDELLAIDAVAGGFSMGKTSAADIGPDGIYMGRASRAGGGTGYGLLMGTTIAGVSRYLLSSADDGLKLVNAEFYQLAPTGAGTAAYVTSQTVNLPAGSQSVTLEILGGGGGGGVYPGGSWAAAGAGGTTTVQLYDGTTYTGTQWTAGGGAAGASTTSSPVTAGQSSPYGTGGTAGIGQRTVRGPGRDNMITYPAVNGGAGSGRGAGGGGGGSGTGVGGQGGGAGQLITVNAYDVSGLANPRLVITIGGGGAAGVNGVAGASSGGAGSGGRVAVTHSGAALVPAGVLPFAPTAAGQFSRAGSATGPSIFPDFGPGLWVLSNGTDGSSLKMAIYLKPGGAWLHCWNVPVATFVTDGRPVVQNSDAAAVTYNYQFYRLKI